MRQLLFFVLVVIPAAACAQHQSKVDFTHADVSITIDPVQKLVKGDVIYGFKVLQDVDSVFLDARNMDFSSVLLNGKKIKYTNTGNRVYVNRNFRADKNYQLELAYTCSPKQTVYFLGWDDSIPDNEQVWTQGQGKYTSFWLPSFDDMEEKVEFDLNIGFNASYEVIANGKLRSVNSISNSSNNSSRSKSSGNSSSIDTIENQQTWHFDMEHPMSSYLLAFAIGDYRKQELVSESGMPIANYYNPQDSLLVEPTYRYSKKVFDFLEKEIGVPYPWQNYKQIPVHDFLYAGMENTGTTIFSDGYVIDSTAFVDKNYVNVSAHELAHQWFGDLVTEKDAGQHWLHEGFATYYAYLTEKELFGEDHFYWKLYSTLTQLQDQVENGEGQSLLDPKASSLTFYEKGAWALFILREKVGDKVFKNGIQNYLRKFQFKNVCVSDFLKEMEKASGRNLADFERHWLSSKSIPFEEAKMSLSKHSASLKLLFEMESDLKKAPGDTMDYAKYWNANPSIHLKKHILEEYSDYLPDGTIQQAFASDTVPLRQALAMAGDIKRFPEEDFESLLDDKSYATIESALYKLWEAYPENRGRYLDRTKEVIGLPNKNVRLLWLTLAIFTDGYQGSRTKQFFDELSGYTDPRYSFEVRQSAFFYLKEAFGFTDKNLKDLIQATNHYNWQFRQFARSVLDEILKDAEYKKRIQNVSNELKTEDLRYLKSITDQQ